jgi:hypothetical protein
MKRVYLTIAIPLFASLVIYLFYRTENTVVNYLAMNLISVNSYMALRDSINRLLPLSRFVIYSLPEGLWVFCITLTSKAFYFERYEKKVSCAIIPLIFSIGLEFCQLLGITNGTFDLMDIGASIVFWTAANYFIVYSREQENILKPINIRSFTCFASYGIVYLSHVPQ